MADETNKWAKLSDVSSETLRYFDGKRVVSKSELAAIIEKSEKAIQRYVKDGMPICKELHQRLFQIFYLDECLEWIKNNLDKRQSKNATKTNKTDKIIKIDISKEDTKDEIKKRVDIREKVHEIKLYLDTIVIEALEPDEVGIVISNIGNVVKLETILEELVPIKNVQKAMIEIIAGLITELKRSVKILPSECENRSKIDIGGILNHTFSATSDRLIGIASTELLSDEKIFEVLEVVYDCMTSGKETETIIKKIQEL